MTDFSVRELEAIKAGGKMAGQYLESINKFDLRSLSFEEWGTFLQCFTKEYHNFLSSEKLVDDEIPF